MSTDTTTATATTKGVTAVTDAPTTTCKGKTRSGARCKRRAVAGGEFCAQHGADTSARAKGASARPRRAKGGAARRDRGAGPIPEDIDRGAFDEIVSDLDSGRRFAAGTATGGGSPFDELANVAEFLTSNLGRVKDALIHNGIVDAGKVERFLADVAHAIMSLAGAVAERMSGDYEEDDFGFDERFTNGVAPLMALLYDYYWRVDVDGIENVPAGGRALLVSNHAGGGIPFDGAMIKMALLREHPGKLHSRMMVLDWAMGLPWFADLMKKTGQVLACSPNALELLERDQVVGVFPEGVKGMAKPFSQRYNLERFGRGGFVRVALRTGAPIVPVAVVGSEEIYPKIGNIPFVNKILGAPFIPMTPIFPLFGLAGLVPLPSKWHIEFCEPIDVSSYGPEALDDRSFVLELSEQIRSTIQQRLRANLLKRNTPFW